MNSFFNRYSPISVVCSPRSALGSIAEADTVFVRILAAEGNGRYTVSFAGRRFSVFSHRLLHKGMAFSAGVKTERGKVILVPRQPLSFSTRLGDPVRRFSSLNTDSSGKLSLFLQQLGLPADSVSFRLVQFFQENGMRFNSRFALKARAAAKRFKGSKNDSEDSAEAALFLLQKGIEPDEQNIAYVLNILHGNGNPDKNGSDFSSMKNFSACLDEKGGDFLPFLYKNAAESLSVPPGLLSFLNQCKSADKHWLILPFEYTVKNRLFNGVIRLLVNLGHKKMEKMVVSAFSSMKNYFFVLYFGQNINTENKIRLDVNYCITPAATNLEAAKLDALLQNLLAGIADSAVCYNQNLFCSGCFTGMPDISFVEARA